VVLLAGCASDGNSGSGSSGGASSTAVPQLGLTGSGGATEALGVSALTDPILGTTGVLGGGGDGQVGGAIPASALAPLSSALKPVVDQVAAAVPLSTITSAVPGLGVDGSGGLVQDVTGQDLLTGVVGSDGLVGSVLGDGNSGALGDVIPAGTIPTLPTGSDPTAALTEVVSTVTGALGGSGGLPSLPTTGTPLDSVTSTLSGLTSGGLPSLPTTGTPIDTVTGLLGSSSDPTAALTGVVGQVTSTLASSGVPVDLTPVTGVVTTVTNALP